MRAAMLEPRRRLVPWIVVSIFQYQRYTTMNTACPAWLTRRIRDQAMQASTYTVTATAVSSEHELLIRHGDDPPTRPALFAEAAF